MRIGLIYALNMEVPSSLSAGRRPEINGAYERLSALFVSMKRKNANNFAYRQLTTSQVRGNDIGIVVSGAGQENSRAATKVLCEQFEPDLIVSTGFCGSTDDAVLPGNVVVATGICCEGSYLPTSTATLNVGSGVVFDTHLTFKSGRIQTFDSVVYSREPVQEGVIAVDMESYTSVSEAANYGIPVLVARVVSDVVPKTNPLMFPKVQARWRIFFRNFELARRNLDQLTDLLI